MGNLLSKFGRRFFRWRCQQPMPRGRHPVVFPVHSDDAPPGRVHPAAPAPVVRPGPRPSRRDLAPLSPGFYIAPRRWLPLPQTRRFPVGILPSVGWKDPLKKKPVLSARNSRMFGPSRTVYIPPLRRRFSLLAPAPEQGVPAEKPGPSSATQCPCPKEAEVGVRAESPARVEKNRSSLVQHIQQNHANSPGKSGDLPLTPGSLMTQGGPRPFSPPTEQVLGEDRLPSVPASPKLGKDKEGEEPSRPSPRKKSCKRKHLEPPLLPPPPLLWDPDELPPPPKVLARDKDLGTLRGTLQSKKTLEDKAEGEGDSSATRPAPSVCAPGLGMADTLPPATDTEQPSGTILARAAADLSSQPVFPGDEDIEMDTTPPCFAATIIPSDDDDDIAMDTTPPCYATTILSSPNWDSRFMPVYQIQYSMGHRQPAGAPLAGFH